MKNFALTILLLASILTSAQDISDPLEMFQEGQFFFVRKDYKEALYFFKKLVNTDKENSHFNFKVGECYLNIPGQEHLAVAYFEKAAKKTVPKKEYKSKEFKERNAPLHSLYYLGNAYRMSGELEMALRAYNKFIDSPYFYGNYNLGVVEAEMKSCERAKIIQDSPIDMEKILVEEPISTSFSEFNPVMSHDGNHLAFVRGLKFYDAIFIADLVDDKWTNVRNISPEIGSDGDYYPTGMNTDGTVMLLVRDIEGNSDIYYSEFDGLNWSKAAELPGKINSLVNETYASFGENDETIYLISNRQRSVGGKDIWKSKKLSNNTWEKPKNLGKEVNSEFDEETPVLCRKNQTLFFSSKGHYNMGGFDIFYVNKNKNDWSVPKNVGYPFNTTRDDLFYMVRPNCDTGYYSIIDTDSGISNIFLIKVSSTLAIPESP